MGGFGSGRQFGANVTEDYRQIDIRRWQREGLLFPGNYINWQWFQNEEKVASIGASIETRQLRLIYSYRDNNSDDWESVNYPVKLQTTGCHYGGVRYWFTCPAVGCGRRVAILYSGGKYFACRHCFQLAYRSQRETDEDRLIRKVNKIRQKLGWKPGILNGKGWKPKGMHWKTFERLQLIHDVYAYRSLEGLAKALKIDISD